MKGSRSADLTAGGAVRSADQPAPGVAAVGRRPGDRSVEMVLDHDPPAEMFGENSRDPRRTGVEDHLLGKALLNGQRPAELAVRVGEDATEPDLVLVPPGMLDRGRRVTRERGEKVRRAGEEGSARPARMDVDRPDRVAAKDQRRAQDGAEVVSLETGCPILVRAVLGDLDGMLGEDRLGRQAFAESELEADHVARHLGDRDDPERVALAVPQEHVAAVGTEQRRGVLDDRGEDGLEIESIRPPAWPS